MSPIYFPKGTQQAVAERDASGATISRAKIWVSDESSSGDEAPAATKAPVPREKKMPKPSAMVEAEKKKKQSGAICATRALRNKHDETTRMLTRDE